MIPIFPFTAIVGQNKMKRALILNAISTRIGGVLIRGERGTAKSTAARALAALLPEIEVVADCPFGCDPDQPNVLCDYCQARVESGEVLPVAFRRTRVVDLPVSATEDRVVGTLDIEQAIKHGEKKFEPGVLAAANRGLLYVDEVNLLDDHVVDLLLDSAAMGVNVVEREGISFSHPAQFILVGTMNPEEGELRPQLLDRFGLWVEIQGITEPEQRMQILERRITFESDPEGFLARWRPEEEKLSRQIAEARRRLPGVTYSPENLFAIAQLTAELGVDGHRADITILKAALAHAALAGRRRINDVDILTAAELALPHRLKRRPLQGSEREMQQLHERLEQARREAEKRQNEEQDDGGVEAQELKKNDELSNEESEAEGQSSEESAADLGEDARPRPQQVPDQSSDHAENGHDRQVAVGDLFKVKKLQTNLDRLTRRMAGKRSFTRTERKRGRYIKARPAGDRLEDVAFDATLRAAAPQQIHRQDNHLALKIHKSEVQRKVRVRRSANLVLFVVDASWSMAASERMEATKGAILSLLLDAYQKRDAVGLVIFQKDKARVMLPPTSSVELAHKALAEIPVGGKTPLSSGLYTAFEIIEREKRANPEVMPLMILLTDGAGNVSMGNMPPQQEAIRIAALFREQHIRSVVINTEHEAFDRGLAQNLADEMGAECFTLKEFSVGALEDVVRQRLR
ncbi:MAG: putative cobaltochelatase [Ardenticatenaceae bacterium]|nr:putative cobaltochelatase [Ardenticatenaceae bacterium]HBY97712.1 putative cobaltochelatase [Chloroflexota bacterium]